MADTNFVDQSSTVSGTSIISAWLNAVNKWLFWGRRPNIATTTGSANAQVLTLEAGSLYAAGSEADGDEFWLAAGFTNTSAMTLQILPPSGANVARAVQLNGQALTGGEVQSGTLYKVQRLGATWQLAASKQILFAGLTAQRTLTLPDANLTIPAVAAKGDLLVGSAAGVLVVQSAGTDGYRLTSNSGDTGGVRYLAPELGFSLINGYLDWTVAASALTVAIKGWDGNDPSATNPVYALIRDVTATTGLPVLVKITAANSVVVSSGSTLGTRNAIPCRVWAVLFNDAGALRLGVINCLTTVAGAGAGSNATAIYPLAGWSIASSTAEGGAGAADSAQTFYTGTAVTSKPYTVLGYATFEAGQATAGTWATAASRKQLWGPSVPLPNQVIQSVVSLDGAAATTAVAIPFDDTIPQNTEGAQFMSQAITPTSAANVLRICHSGGLWGAALQNDTAVVGLFQDAVANALAVVSGGQNGAANGNFSVPLLEYWLLAAVTTATTLKIRAGCTTANTLTFNGTSGARKLGGGAVSYLKLEELMG